jgi:hypothetical protein
MSSPLGTILRLEYLWFYGVTATDIHANESRPTPPLLVEMLGVADQRTPPEYALEQNYPNPFNPTTEIRYSLPRSGRVRLSVYDMLGREVARPVDGVQTAGHRSSVFDASRLPNGIYFYRLVAGGFSRIMKMAVIT